MGSQQLSQTTPHDLVVVQHIHAPASRRVLRVVSRVSHHRCSVLSPVRPGGVDSESLTPASPMLRRTRIPVRPRAGARPYAQTLSPTLDLIALRQQCLSPYPMNTLGRPRCATICI